MKKLSKTQQKEKDRHSSELFDAHVELEIVVGKYNDALEALKADVENAAHQYNQALQAASDFCGEVVSEMENYEGERSDKWQESDAASSFQDWKSEWENVDFEDFEPEFPEPMEAPENPQETLDGIPDEASS